MVPATPNPDIPRPRAGNIIQADVKTPLARTQISSQLLRTVIKPLSPSVICVAEHWCNPSSLPFAIIPGYTKAAAFCRTSSIHGGTLIFVKYDLEFKIIGFADLRIFYRKTKF
ncbi:hypothetical protein WA026_013950 [Henosepilachna vigintioctopunctata]|uniref:Uncharacterized protein n=1 Tax=Henosepilachna vigintioctopunctata TaxID=420089 RepID=A0AAW1U6L0_9CUCU